MFCLKYVFFFFNFLLFCCGVAAAAVGIWTLTDPAVLQKYIELPIDKLYIVSCVVTVVGFVLVITGFIGCCGVLLENACFLCLFSIIMVLLLLAGAVVAAVIWIAINNETFGNKIKAVLFDQIEDTDVFNKMQTNLKCCGITGKSDYIDNNKGIPESCKDENGKAYTQGCWTKIKDTLTKKANVLAGMSATLVVLGIISTVVSFIILCTMKRAAKAI